MRTDIPKSVIDLIKAERKRRLSSLPKHPDAAYDQWLYTDEPFLNELCLMLLIAVRHEVERELVWIVARAGDDGRELSDEEYTGRVQDWRDCIRSKGWGKLEAALRLKTVEEWDSSMKTLQLIANSYKHDPWSTPDETLQAHLVRLLSDRRPDLSQVKNFAPLPESDAFRQRVAASLNLTDSADYCEIVSDFLARAERFLTEVRKRSTLSPVKRGPVSLNPDDFLQ